MLLQGIRLGKIASEKLGGAQTLTIVGITSRGCFLQTESAWTIFLTEENTPGPVTINLPPDAIAAIQPATGQKIGMNNGILHFSNQVRLCLQAAPIWQPAPPPAIILPIATRQESISQAIRLVVDHKAGTGLSGVLPDLIPLLTSCPTSGRESGPFTEKLAGLIECLQTAECGRTVLSSHLAAFLGQGNGLTPSGDDFLLGLFLAWQRWQPVLDAEYLFRPHAQYTTREAWQKTTSLSASLIECGLNGQADQRLISALDGIMTSADQQPQWLNGILGWGHSSGCDALAGMILALSPKIKLDF